MCPYTPVNAEDMHGLIKRRVEANAPYQRHVVRFPRGGIRPFIEIAHQPAGQRPYQRRVVRLSPGRGVCPYTPVNAEDMHGLIKRRVEANAPYQRHVVSRFPR